MHLFRDPTTERELIPGISLLIRDLGYQANDYLYVVLDFSITIQVISNPKERRSIEEYHLNDLLAFSALPRQPALSVSSNIEDREGNMSSIIPGAVWKILVKQNGTVLDIKKKIREQTNLNLQGVHLLWNGQELMQAENTNAICQIHGIQHKSVLQIWIEDGWISLDIHEPFRGHVSTIALYPNMDTLETFPAGNFVIDEHVLIRPTDGLCLAYNEHKQEEQATFAARGITESCAMYVTWKSPSGNQRGCVIPKAENRGITIVQLREIATAIVQRCGPEGWTSTNPLAKGKLLKPQEVTLYDLTHHYVYPLTSQRKCSYVELVSNDPEEQTPCFFCSHWWGESVFQFVACLEQHAKDRNIRVDKDPYWICAYALNQHNMSGELQLQPESKSVNDPKAGPFFRAMQLTKGTVSVLDENATCYSRIWCSFEVSMVIEMKQNARISAPSGQHRDGYFYDVYAARTDEAGNPRWPVGLTDGRVASDKYSFVDGRVNLNMPHPETWWNMTRSRRQSGFPLGICHKALAAKLEEADATMEQDKRAILNSIIGANTNDFFAEPPKTHMTYDQLNASLHGRFAEMAYNMALENGDPKIELFRQALASAPVPNLSMSFKDNRHFRDEAEHFTKALPLSLEYLDLDIAGIGFRTSNEFAVGLGRLVDLVYLKLYAPYCVALSDVGQLWKELQMLSRLKELHLSLRCCPDLESVDGLGEVIGTLPQLSYLSISLRGCKLFSSLKSLSEGLQSTCLVKCHLDFSHRSLEGFEIDLDQFPSLEELSLSAIHCGIVAASMISAEQAINLITLKLDMSSNHQLTSPDEIGKLLRYFPLLQRLELVCQDCSSITSIQELAKGIVYTAKLSKLHLNFKDCKSLESVQGLGDAMLQLSLLEESCLNFSGCGTLSSINDLRNALQSLGKQHELVLAKIKTLRQAWRALETWRVEGRQGSVRL